MLNLGNLIPQCYIMWLLPNFVRVIYEKYNSFLFFTFALYLVREMIPGGVFLCSHFPSVHVDRSIPRRVVVRVRDTEEDLELVWAIIGQQIRYQLAVLILKVLLSILYPAGADNVVGSEV